MVFAEKDGVVTQLDEGDNPIGEVPLTCLYHESGDKAVRWHAFDQERRKISAIALELLSNIDSVSALQCFSQAVLKSKGSPSEMGLGSNVVIKLGILIAPLNEDFYYRSPDAAPLANLWSIFADTYRLALKSMSLVGDPTQQPTQAESGISLQWRWAELEKRLVANDLSRAIGGQFDLEPDGEVQW